MTMFASSKRGSISHAMPVADATAARLQQHGLTTASFGSNPLELWAVQLLNSHIALRVGFNEKTWLDRLGHAHSEQLKVTENFRRIDRDHLELDIKMEDPKALARPWVTTFYYENRPQWELGEISCSGDYLDWTQVEKGGREYKR